ncbi:MAG TPA: hypothetical protein DCR93_25800 [Cytophagales bacterium]|nr:hypothetical protein [Cytophagales bacterium]
MTQAQHKNWLIVSALAVGSFGPVFFFGTMVATMEPARFTLDLLSWPLDGATTYESPDVRFLSAVTGGVLLGWGILIVCLRQWVYDLAPEAIRKCVVISLLVWFVFDSGGSITSGNPSNVLANILLLLLAVGPLWRPAKQV